MDENNVQHNHSQPKEWIEFQCPACDAIKNNLVPSEDGFYQFEQDNPAFVSQYWAYWDELEDAGQLTFYDTPYGPMIDNTHLLQLTRQKMKLANPNDK